MTERIYPLCCLSAYCGKTNCEGCINKEKLDEFKAWTKKTNAKPIDPIWCRTIYRAYIEK